MMVVKSVCIECALLKKEEEGFPHAEYASFLYTVCINALYGLLRKMSEEE
jgi:hypothetical protein